MPFIEERIGEESLVWIKIDVRHSIMHLLPFHRKETLCGIPSEAGINYPDGKFKKCETCEKKLREFKKKYSKRLSELTLDL